MLITAVSRVGRLHDSKVREHGECRLEQSKPRRNTEWLVVCATQICYIESHTAAIQDRGVGDDGNCCCSVGEGDAGPEWMDVPEFFACLIGLGPRLAV